MRKRISTIVSAILALTLLLGGVFVVPTSAEEAENAPVIVKSEFYDSAKKIGNELPISDLTNYVSDGVKGGFGTPYTPAGYRSPRYTTYKVYVAIEEGKTASDYSFRILCGTVDTSGETPVSVDKYVTRTYVMGTDDTEVAITEEVVDGVSCVVCTYTLTYKPAFNVDDLTVEQAEGTVDIVQLFRIFCEVTDIDSKKSSTSEKNAFYVSEKFAKTSVRDMNSFVKENYNLGLLTPEIYYKNNEGVYTNEADGTVRLPGDKIELALYIPNLADVPHITGMTAQAMNSNYNKFTANSPEMRLEWYGANLDEDVEEYLGCSYYAVHELFHEWYYEWQDSEYYLLGTDTVSALHPETTYSLTDDLWINYQYVYCRITVEINTGAASATFSTTTDYFELPGYSDGSGPEKYEVTIDGEVFGEFEAGETVNLPVPEMKIQNTRAYRFFTYTGAEVIRSAYNSRNSTANGRTYTLVMPEGNVELTAEYVMIGDATLDGRLNSRDTNKVNQIVAMTSAPSSDKQAEAADVNLDGRYNSRDSINAKKLLAGGYTPSK